MILLVIIFIFSQQPGDISYAISDYFGNLINQIVAAFSIDLSEVSFRKIAHLILYFLLGLFSTLMFEDFFKRGKLNYEHLISTACSFIFCTLAAAFDEWHQTFIAERTGQVKDVFLDMAGFGVAIILTETLIFLKQRDIKC